MPMLRPLRSRGDPNEVDDAARRLPRGLPEPLLGGGGRRGTPCTRYPLGSDTGGWSRSRRITQLSLRLRPRDFGVAYGYHRSNGTHEEVTDRHHMRRKPERSAERRHCLARSPMTTKSTTRRSRDRGPPGRRPRRECTGKASMLGGPAGRARKITPAAPITFPNAGCRYSALPSAIRPAEQKTSNATSRPSWTRLPLLRFEPRGASRRWPAWRLQQ